MIRLLGAGLVLAGAVTIGIRKASSFHSQMRQLRELLRGMELLQCELNYTLYPVPKVLEIVSGKLQGPVREYFRHLSHNISAGLSRDLATQEAISKTKHLMLPSDALFTLMDFSNNLGSYDLDGEDRMTKLSIHRITQSIELMEQEKRPFVKSYIVLATCAGIALVILMI